MLKGTKSVSMNFNSMINGRPVVYMSAADPGSWERKHQYYRPGS